MSGSVLLEKKIAGDLRKAQNSMFSGKNDDAWRIIGAVVSDISQLRSVDPGNRSIASFEQQSARLKQDLEKRLKKDVVSAPSVAATTIPHKISPASIMAKESTSVKVSNESKLPGGVTKRLEEMDKRLLQAEDSLCQAETRLSVDRARRHLDYLRGSFEELERMYREHLGHPDVLKLKEKLSDFTSRLDGVQGRLESGEAQVKESKLRVEGRSMIWMEKMRPYLQGGVREKQLELSRIRGKQSLIHQRDLLTDAKNLLKEFEALDWSLGMSGELEEAVKGLKCRIDEGQAAFDQSVAGVLGEAGSFIDEKLALFDKDSSWRNDASIRPDWLSRGDRESIEGKMGLVDELIPEIIPESSPELIDLKKRLRELEEENQSRLAELPRRTFMAPTRYDEDDAYILKEKAGQLVKDVLPEALILRVHLIRDDWRVEDIVEHTDTSMTAIRRRVTYHMPAQVAARVDDEIQLYNVHIAKNQRPNGSFDDLYGNLEEYPQAIAFENLPK